MKMNCDEFLTTTSVMLKTTRYWAHFLCNKALVMGIIEKLLLLDYTHADDIPTLKFPLSSQTVSYTEKRSQYSGVISKRLYNHRLRAQTFTSLFDSTSTVQNT